MNINPLASCCAVCESLYLKENPSGKLQTCSGCRAVSYCSRECQKEHWSVHKKLCMKVTTSTIQVSDGSNRLIGSTTIRRVPAGLATPRTVDNTMKKIGKIRLGAAVSDPARVPSSPSSYKVEGNERLLTKLFLEDNLPPVMRALEGERDLDLSISWIEEQLTTAFHPILCLELFRLKLQKNLSSPFDGDTSSKLVEAFAYKMLGGSLLAGDIACIDDPSAASASSILHMKYNSWSEDDSNRILQAIQAVTEFDSKVKNCVKEKLEYLKENPQFLGSPCWAREHGMSVYMGIDATRPQEEWNPIRLKKIDEVLEQLAL